VAQEPLVPAHLVKVLLVEQVQTPALKQVTPQEEVVVRGVLEEQALSTMLVTVGLHTHLLFLAHLQRMPEVVEAEQVLVRELQV
jgi:hypothetical protein